MRKNIERKSKMKLNCKIKLPRKRKEWWIRKKVCTEYTNNWHFFFKSLKAQYIMVQILKNKFRLIFDKFQNFSFIANAVVMEHWWSEDNRWFFIIVSSFRFFGIEKTIIVDLTILAFSLCRRFDQVFIFCDAHHRISNDCVKIPRELIWGSFRVQLLLFGNSKRLPILWK